MEPQEIFFVCFHLCFRNLAELWGLFNIWRQMGPVGDEKWGDKLSVVIDEADKEYAERMYGYKSLKTALNWVAL